MMMEKTDDGSFRFLKLKKYFFKCVKICEI